MSCGGSPPRVPDSGVRVRITYPCRFRTQFLTDPEGKRVNFRKRDTATERVRVNFLIPYLETERVRVCVSSVNGTGTECFQIPYR